MSRGRRRTVKALVALGSVLAFLSVFAIWVERQALNTDDWVETSDRLIQDETIRAAVADYLVDQLYENVDVEQELKDILPGETKELAGPVSGGLRQVAGDGANEVLKTSTAQSLWEEANRTAHEELVAVLEERKGAVSTEEGTVKLQLGALITNLADQVGIGADLAERLPPDAGEITILRSDELDTAQNITAAIKGLALVLSILTLLTFGLAVYLSRDGRWVTVLFCGVGLIAAGFAVIVARQATGGIVLDQLVVDESIRPAADRAWSISTSLMVSIATTVIVFGALAVLAGWLGSPVSSARATRKAAAPVLRDHVAYVYAGLAVLIGIYFLSAPTQNLRSFLTTLIVAAMIALGVHELRKQTEEEFPDAEFSDVFGRTRDRMVGAVKDANLGEKAAKLRDSARESARSIGGDTAGGEPRGDAGDGKPAEDARLERLERLGALHEKGILSDEEFAAEKARVLGGGKEPS